MPSRPSRADLAVLAVVLAVGALVTLSIPPSVVSGPVGRPARAATLGGLAALSLAGASLVAVAAGSALGSRR
ncbi:hypothetical protein ACFQPA_04310 [Halomarina halobia]|uniref:Uncharacterized protein n=1 Tax=Halomarina halobia TaxID=3033386 RepID=A0ABD6A6Q6_9EURY|nr:hypothetical protein [Halomarina sp. PSR21]